jgi:uncharacterized protein (TIRG00374 family)
VNLRPAPSGRREGGERAEHHGLHLSRRKAIAVGLFLVLSLVALYYLVPRLAGLEQTWNRIERGDPAWLGLAFLLTVGSWIGYVALFRGVFVRGGSGVGWRASYQITMAGLAATRLFAAGGAGGIVLTAWALRRSGMSARQVADHTVAFIVLTYMTYAAALVVFGFGLRVGLLEGPAPFGVTVPPALIGCAAFALALAIAFVPTDLQRRFAGWGDQESRLGRWKAKAANVPASASSGIREALHHLGSRDPALIGSIAFWGCQIAVLWAGFRAFGEAPPVAVLVMAFFVGMFGNLLPLPGGVGGVEGGMIGALVAFRVEAGLAVVAVLVYRAFVFWLPMIPGVIAYFQLRRTVERWRGDGRGPEPGPAPEPGARAAERLSA